MIEALFELLTLMVPLLAALAIAAYISDNSI
jgi:hypothetical protein